MKTSTWVGSVIICMASLSFSIQANAQNGSTRNYELKFKEAPGNKEAKAICSFLNELDGEIDPRMSLDKRSLNIHSTSNVSLNQIIQYVLAFGLTEPDVHLGMANDGDRSSNVTITYGDIPNTLEK